MNRNIIPCFLMLAGPLGACAPQDGYYWGDYESRLQAYYEDPQDLGALVADLESTIVRGEEKQKVPPGLFAEYGYLLLVERRNDEAITYFTKEKTAWPEATVLMDKMIAFAVADRGQTTSANSGGGD